MRVLIIPDKFKGTLTAQQAAEAIAKGWQARRPDDELDLLPMSDGGDGFGEVLGQLLEGDLRTARVVNAAHEETDADWWWSESQRSAVVESAKVNGLAMLPAAKFHPFELDTFGLGQLLSEIVRAHPGARLLIGIGGSATNDAGFGMARALGYQFEDAAGVSIDRWVELDRLSRIIPPSEPRPFGKVTIACDVQNRLQGPEGATRIYGPQKGMRPQDFPLADRAFERLSEVAKKDLGVDRADEPGTGAAGGLGYGLRAFLDGTFKPGFDIFAEAAGLDKKIAAADLIVTGEGSIDRQTAMGKGTGAIATRARAANKPCIGLAGLLAKELKSDLFFLARGVAPVLTTPENARKDAFAWLAKLSTLTAEECSRRGVTSTQSLS